MIRTLVSLPTATHSSDDYSINTKLLYMKFLTILIKYILHEHHNHSKIKIQKSSKKVRGVSPLKTSLFKLSVLFNIKLFKKNTTKSNKSNNK